LQDITGGEIVFGVGINSLMVDITTRENRTRRIAVLDTFFLLGLAVGLQLSGIIRHFFGWVPLFITSSLVLVLNILYVIFKIEESNKVEDDLPIKDKTKVEQSKGNNEYIGNNQHCLFTFSYIPTYDESSSFGIQKCLAEKARWIPGLGICVHDDDDYSEVWRYWEPGLAIHVPQAAV
jgi:MFS family permease